MLSVVFTLALLGVILWALFRFVPMPQEIKTLIIVFVVICVIFWLLNIFGFNDIPIPHRRY